MNREMKAVKIGTLYADPGRPPLHDVVVTFDSKIRGVVPASDAGSPDRSVEIIDLGDRVMVPGLIDAHAHLLHPGDIFRPEDVPLYTEGMEMQIGVRNARRALEKGVTTIRDAGGRAEVIFDLRRGIREGLTAGPDLLVAGAALTSTGGHGYRMGGAVDGTDAVRKKVREHCLMGADYVKVLATGGGTPGTLPGVLNLNSDELQAASGEAHRLTRKITAHATSKEGIIACLDAHYDGIEHCYFMTSYRADYDPALAERIAEQNVVVCPTLSVFTESIEYLKNLKSERPLTEYETERLAWFTYMEDTLQELCAFMVRDGVRMIAGTDAGWRLNTFGNLYKELELMSKSGMTNIDVLRSATSCAADALGVSEKVGRIATGLQADMLIIDGDPMKSVSDLSNVVQVFKGGAAVLPLLNP